MNMTQEDELLEFARGIIEDAGEIALKYFRKPIPIDSKDSGAGFDPVTAADRGIESYIRERILSMYPDHSILGEEEADHTGCGDYRWFVDPIDGTRAYISGSPLWGILLGLMRGDEYILGLMHQPYIKETFTGSRAGAFCDRGSEHRPITTRATRLLSESTLYSTHPSMFNDKEDYARFIKVADNCRLMRYGGDCYSYCLLASGCIDLVIEHLGGPYDIVPLIPIIDAAGGTVTDWQGGSARSGGRIIAAANQEVHEQALALLNG